MFQSDHGPSGVYQGHGFSFGHVTQSGHQDPSIPGRLVGSCLFRGGSYNGKGHCVGSLLGLRYSCKLRQVSPHSDSIIDLPGHGNREPDFEGFPNSGETPETSIANRRIPVRPVRLAGKRRLLRSLLGRLSSLSSGYRGSSQDEISPTDPSRSLGFSG